MNSDSSQYQGADKLLHGTLLVAQFNTYCRGLVQVCTTHNMMRSVATGCTWCKPSASLQDTHTIIDGDIAVALHLALVKVVNVWLQSKIVLAKHPQDCTTHLTSHTTPATSAAVSPVCHADVHKTLVLYSLWLHRKQHANTQTVTIQIGWLNHLTLMHLGISITWMWCKVRPM